MSGIVTVYHGSRNGLQGAIRPESDGACDFGTGFYMGTDASQPKTLVCNATSPVFYRLRFDLRGMNVVRFEPGEEWALFVAFNRGLLEKYSSRRFYRRFEDLRAKTDVIVGKIANDRMFSTFYSFFEGSIGMPALLGAHQALDLGDHYCALTERACANISVVSEKRFSGNELSALRDRCNRQRRRGMDEAKRICNERRREGKSFYDLLKEWK